MKCINVDGWNLSRYARLVDRATFLENLSRADLRWGGNLMYAMAYGLGSMADHTGTIRDFHPPAFYENGPLDSGLQAALGRDKHIRLTYDSFANIAMAHYTNYLDAAGFLAWHDDNQDNEEGIDSYHLALPVDLAKIRAEMLATREFNLFPLLGDELWSRPENDDDD